MPPRTRVSTASSLPRDISQFLASYPSSTPNPSRTANLDFYQGRIAAKPSKKKVEELQDSLRGNWEELEYNHSFVQWLFPIRSVRMLLNFMMEYHKLEGWVKRARNADLDYLVHFTENKE